MLINAEGGNQTENGGLPRPAVEEEEDEDDPDKLMGKFFSHVLFKTEHGNQLYEMFYCVLLMFTHYREAQTAVPCSCIS